MNTAFNAKPLKANDLSFGPSRIAPLHVALVCAPLPSPGKNKIQMESIALPLTSWRSSLSPPAHLD